MESVTKKEKLRLLNSICESNKESRKTDMRNMPKEYIFDKIDSLHMHIDTLISNYIDAVESMSEEQFQRFERYQFEKYNA